MKHLKRFLILLVIGAMLLSPASTFARDTWIRAGTGLTGGLTGTVDKILYADIQDKDIFIVSVKGDKTYHLVFNSSSSAAESSPDVVKPDDAGANNGRWILTDSYSEKLNGIETGADVTNFGPLEAYRQGMVISRKDNDNVYVSAGALEINSEMYFVQGRLTCNGGSPGYLNYIDKDDQGGAAYNVWGDGTFIYLANSLDGLLTYSVDALGNLTYINTDNQSGYANNVWGDGTFIYLANGSGGLHTYSVDGSGVLTHIDFDDQGGDAKGVWGDGNFIYLANGDAGLYSYSVDVSGNLTYIGFDDQGGSARGVWGDGNFIYLANDLGGLHTYSVDVAGNLTHIAFDDQGGSARGVWGDGNFIYLANYDSGLLTYSVDVAGNLTYIDSDNQLSNAYDVWGDGDFIYLANYDSGLHTYSVDVVGNLTHIDSDDQGGTAYGVWGDGNFIYLANSAWGLLSYEEIGGGSSYSAGTTYYIYTDIPVSGTTLANGDVKISTTAPAFVDAKGAKYRSDDATQRWIGSFVTDGDGYITNIIQPLRLDISTFIDGPLSPMILTGGVLSNGTNAGTFKVTILTAILRATDSATGVLTAISLAEQDNQAITAADTTYYVILSYGTPCTITISETAPNFTQNISLGKVMKDASNNVSWISGGFRLQGGVAKLWKRSKALRQIELTSGNTIAYSGTNNFTMTAGVVYAGGNKITQALYDSAVTQFTPVYQSAGAGWTEGAASNVIDYAHYDDGDGTLGNVGNNKFGCHWVYRHVDDAAVYVVYGRDSYAAAEADVAGEPSKPDHLTDFGCLIGKIIAPHDGGSFSDIQMVTDRFFVGTSVSDHNSLGGLDGGGVGEYYHLYLAEHTIVTRAATNALPGYATTAHITAIEANTAKVGFAWNASTSGTTGDGLTLSVNGQAGAEIDLINLDTNNTNSTAAVSLLYGTVEDNVGTGTNSGCFVVNNNAQGYNWAAATLPSGIAYHVYQSASGTAFNAYGANNVNTAALYNATISDTQSGASTLYRADIGVANQASNAFKATGDSPNVNAKGFFADMQTGFGGDLFRGSINDVKKFGVDKDGNIFLAGLVDGIDIAVDVAANTLKETNADHTGEVTGSAALTITNKAVTLAKMNDMATASFIGRDTAGAGVPEVISKATALGILNVEDGADKTDAVNIASSIHGVAAKNTPANADEVGLIDSAAANVLKKLTWANVKATLKTYFDTLYQSVMGANDNYVTDAEKTVIGNTSGTNTGDESTATTSAEGVVELAIASEVNTGNSTTRAVTPDALAGSVFGTKTVIVKCIADDTALTTGNGKTHFTVPIELNGMNLVTVGGHVYTVSSSGTPTFQIHNLTDGSDMLSTRITIDQSEKDSSTDASQAVINTAEDDVVTGDEIRLDCDVAGTGTKGMEIRLGFRKP